MSIFESTRKMTTNEKMCYDMGYAQGKQDAVPVVRGEWVMKRYVFSAEKHIVEAIKNVKETLGIKTSAAISLLITEGYHSLSKRIRMKTTEGTYKCQNCQNLVESEHTNKLFCAYHSDGEYQHETFLDDYCSYFESKKEGE